MTTSALTLYRIFNGAQKNMRDLILTYLSAFDPVNLPPIVDTDDAGVRVLAAYPYFIQTTKRRMVILNLVTKVTTVRKIPAYFTPCGIDIIEGVHCVGGFTRDTVYEIQINTKNKSGKLETDPTLKSIMMTEVSMGKYSVNYDNIIQTAYYNNRVFYVQHTTGFCRVYKGVLTPLTDLPRVTRGPVAITQRYVATSHGRTFWIYTNIGVLLVRNQELVGDETDIYAQHSGTGDLDYKTENPIRQLSFSPDISLLACKMENRLAIYSIRERKFVLDLNIAGPYMFRFINSAYFVVKQGTELTLWTITGKRSDSVGFPVTIKDIHVSNNQVFIQSEDDKLHEFNWNV